MYQSSAKHNDDEGMMWITDDDDDFEKDEQQHEHHRVQIYTKKTKTNILLKRIDEHGRSLNEMVQVQKRQQENFRKEIVQLQKKQQENLDKLLMLMMNKMDIIINGLDSNKKTINERGVE